jgi:hypothetical protein
MFNNLKKKMGGNKNRLFSFMKEKLSKIKDLCTKENLLKMKDFLNKDIS